MLCSGNIINTMVTVTRPLLHWRFLLKTKSCTAKLLSSSVAPTPAIAKQEETENTVKTKRSNSMITAAFQSLKSESLQNNIFASIDDQISAAQTVDHLLSVADSKNLTKKHALKVVSVLAEWGSENKVQISDFETDTRFNKLCRMLGRSNFKNSKSSLKVDSQDSADLATVLEVTGDDEAAKMVATISFEQMIKVMATLAIKKRRSTPLLRSLAYNLCQHEQQLNVKQSADLLFTMSVLNFPDANLLDKVRSDLTESLPTNQKAAPVGSVLTSIGLLRYKDPALLDVISEWVCRNTHECRPQDLVSFLLTLAHVGYTPSNEEQVFKQVLGKLTSPQDTPTLTAWLDVVWSLSVLSRVTPALVTTVLDPQFFAKLEAEHSLSVAAKLKLLNINAVAKLELQGYKGPLLDPSKMEVSLARTRSKEQLTKNVLDTLTNLLSNETYLKAGRDTGMGFLIEGECLLDAKGNPLPVTDTTELIKKQKPNGKSIALVVWDYSDMCRGVTDPSGPNALASRLLKHLGYRVFSVPHSEFNPRDQLVQRVQYLEQCLKALARQPASR